MTTEEKLAACLANVNAAYDALLAAIAENPYSREAVDCHDAWRDAGMVYAHACEMAAECDPSESV